MKFSALFALAATTLFACLSTSSASSVVDLTKPYPVYFGTMERVIDGDTMIVTVDLWPGLSGKFPVRVRGIDAPETRGTACEDELVLGLKAKEVAEKLYDLGSQVRLEGIELDSFGRILADVSRLRSDRWLYLKDELIDRQLAVEWTPDMDDVPWCSLAKTWEPAPQN